MPLWKRICLGLSWLRQICAKAEKALKLPVGHCLKTQFMIFQVLFVVPGHLVRHEQCVMRH